MWYFRLGIPGYPWIGTLTWIPKVTNGTFADLKLELQMGYKGQPVKVDTKLTPYVQAFNPTTKFFIYCHFAYVIH